MPNIKSLQSTAFLQFYSFFTVILYGFYFFKEAYQSDLPFYYIPIAFIIIWQTLFICFRLLFPRRLIKQCSIILAICNAFVFYFMYTYHTPIDNVMIMNTLQTDIGEASELLNFKLLICILLLGIIPTIIIYLCSIRRAPYSKIFKYCGQSLIIILLLGGLFYQSTNLMLRRFKYLMNYLPPINYLAGTAEVLIDKLTPRPPLQKITEDIKKIPVTDKPNIIIFVLGETTRAANFSLNGYHRPTNQALTPYLDNIIYYPNVQSCGTSTAVSVPCIFSVYDRKHFKIGSEEYMENVLDIFKAAGYKIRWLDNDGGCKDVCNRTLYEEPCDDKNCLDDILLQNLKQKIEQESDNQLIVLHTRGSHGPAYHLHYDEKSNLYQPICTSHELWTCSPEELTNVYDNTIDYVSKFIARTIDILQSVEDHYNPALLYTSDHGESLMENGIFLHAAPYKTAPIEQKQVPMLLWLPQNNSYKLQQTCIRNKAAKQTHSHDNIFHSLLGLADIKSKNYQKELDIFAGCRK